MGEWVVGALINIVGSIAINFGTNLLKLGHDQREKLSTQSIDDGHGKLVLKPIMHFQTWRIGILFFALGNCLNFISFAYAAQSLLAALGSIQFVSNIAFAYFVLNKTVSVKVIVATTFIVCGNIFLVSFGNHQSPVYTPEQLIAKYSNLVFVLYCLSLVFIVLLNLYLYRKGEAIVSCGNDISAYWRTLLPFSYAVVSGAVGSCSVLFAKSLSNMLRLTVGSGYSLQSWFTYSMFLLFLSTAGFWMTRLNEGLSLFDVILIVPMFQIAWTFFSICTGFVYFQEYQVFSALRATMFVLGISFVFVGISLLAPDDAKVNEIKDSAIASQASATDMKRLSKLLKEETEIHDLKSLMIAIAEKARSVLFKAKSTCSLSLGMSDEPLGASSVLVMPMVSSRTTGFRAGTFFDRTKFSPLRNSEDWGHFSLDEDDSGDDLDIADNRSLLP